jgi:hypothetical protein
MDDDNSHWWWALGVAVVAGLGFAWYYLWHTDHAPVPSAPSVAQAPAPVPAAPEEEKIEHPLPPAEPPPALPTLADSDKLVQESVSSVAGRQAQALLTPPGLARRLVAMVDNLPRAKLPTKIVPLQRPAGNFSVIGEGDERSIAPGNALRYATYVKLLENVDTRILTTAYVKLYPLLQQAYREQGYPKAYFNDRVVQVIDHLLATPEIRGPVRVTQPKVLFEFADPALEARSAGQKALIRMGPDNAARVKAKLRQIREAIAAQGSIPAPPDAPARAGDVPATGAQQ